jgi:hypothetical protein
LISGQEPGRKNFDPASLLTLVRATQEQIVKHNSISTGDLEIAKGQEIRAAARASTRLLLWYGELRSRLETTAKMVNITEKIKESVSPQCLPFGSTLTLM